MGPEGVSTPYSILRVSNSPTRKCSLVAPSSSWTWSSLLNSAAANWLSQTTFKSSDERMSRAGILDCFRPVSSLLSSPARPIHRTANFAWTSSNLDCPVIPPLYASTDRYQYTVYFLVPSRCLHRYITSLRFEGRSYTLACLGYGIPMLFRIFLLQLELKLSVWVSVLYSNGINRDCVSFSTLYFFRFHWFFWLSDSRGNLRI